MGDGFKLFAPKDRVEELLELPGVVSIFDDGFSQLETVASPQFIGADRFWEELGGPEQAGEGIIVGVIDSGVWPESPSFSDPDPNGNPYPLRRPGGRAQRVSSEATTRST